MEIEDLKNHDAILNIFKILDFLKPAHGCCLPPLRADATQNVAKSSRGLCCPRPAPSGTWTP
eukprot:5281069-Heterocapsa_arctica.AAC.1